MTFLHPGYLLGLVGLAVPVLIHLFGRRRPRRVQFPSLRLVRRTAERQRALLRLKHLIVLLLRLLAVLFCVLAVAGPQVGSGWLARVVGSRGRTVIVLLDDSASMGAVAAGQTPFARAAGAGRELLEALSPGAAVVLARTSDAEAPTLSAPLAAEEAIPAQPSAAGGPIAPALERCLEALLGAETSDRRVYVLSDLQATAWRDVAMASAVREGLSAGGVSVTIVDCGAEEPENWAILETSPRTLPVVAGRSVRLKVHVQRHGGDQPSRRRVTLRLGDDRAESKTVVVDPSGAAYVEFSRRFPAPGVYAGRVELPRDALPADNVRHYLVRAGEPVRVLCVGAQEEFRYVRDALRPPGSEASPVTVTIAAPSSFSVERIQDLEVLALGQVRAPDQAILDALNERPELGVLLFLGEGADADYYNHKLLPALFGEKGVRVGGVISARPGQYHVLAEVETGRGPLRPFAEPRAGDLSRAHYMRMRDVEVGPGARILATFDNGIPALVESVGRRRAAVVNSSADAAWSDAPFQMAFVPLMHHLIYYLAEPQRPEPPHAVVGQPLAVAEGWYMVPGGRHVGAEELGESGPPWPGAYRDAEGRPAFAANVDQRESDLRRISPAAVRSRLRGLSAEVIAAEDLDQVLARTSAPSADLSSLFFLLAFACLAGELWLSARGRTAPTAPTAPA
ncbi:MAG: BatA domain-containing protein [Armatimonadota bacterium]